MDMCKAVAPLVGTDSARHLTPRAARLDRLRHGLLRVAFPPSYSDSGAGSPLLVALNGYGENGDGTAEGLNALLATGIPRFIDVGGWPTDRPLVVSHPNTWKKPPASTSSPATGPTE